MINRFRDFFLRNTQLARGRYVDFQLRARLTALRRQSRNRQQFARVLRKNAAGIDPAVMFHQIPRQSRQQVLVPRAQSIFHPRIGFLGEGFATCVGAVIGRCVDHR